MEISNLKYWGSLLLIAIVLGTLMNSCDKKWAHYSEGTYVSKEDQILKQLNTIEVSINELAPGKCKK